MRGPCWSCRPTAELAVWHQLDSIHVNGIQPGLALLCLSQQVLSPQPDPSPLTPPPQSRVLYFPNPVSQRRCFIGPLKNTLNSPFFIASIFWKPQLLLWNHPNLINRLSWSLGQRLTFGSLAYPFRPSFNMGTKPGISNNCIYGPGRGKKKEKRKKESKLLISRSVKARRSAPRLNLAAQARETRRQCHGGSEQLSLLTQILWEPTRLWIEMPASVLNGPSSDSLKCLLTGLEKKRARKVCGMSIRLCWEGEDGRNSEVCSWMTRIKPKAVHCVSARGHHQEGTLLLGSCQGEELPGMDHFLGCHTGAGGLGMSPHCSFNGKVMEGQGLQCASQRPSCLPPMRNSLPHHQNSVPSLCLERSWKNQYLCPFFQTHFKHQYPLKPTWVLF